MPYLDSLDIANRVCQFVGCPKILDIDEDSIQNTEITFAYDKLREAELRRNVWKFAIRNAILRAIDTDTMVLVPAEWDTVVTYLSGSIVKDENGLLWMSAIPNNRANEPGQSTAWERYFGPLTVTAFDADDEIAYSAGELVYVVTGEGGYVVFVSLTNENEDVPSTTSAWASTTTYKMDDVVSHSGSNWRSLIEINLAITPAEGPNAWDEDAIYTVGNDVTGSDGFQYEAQGTTTGDDPTTDDGTNWVANGTTTGWTAIPTLYTAALTWRPLFAGLEHVRLMYPPGVGPSSQAQTRNLFRLPSGYLRMAHQNPKAGSFTLMGSPTGLSYSDWDFQGNYFSSGAPDAILFRFVANVTTVSDMDAMFCDGLAARIGMAVCEPITQSGSKLKDIAGQYQTFMTEARLANALEVGAVEPPEDDFLACRR